jgi:exonuclease SbcD
LEPLNILHTSDLHLDHVLTEYRREVRAVRRGELIGTFNLLVSEAIRLDVRLLLVAGDLICTQSAADSTVEVVRDAFARLGRNSIFVAVIPGDAEEEGGLELLRDACSGENVHLFLGEEWSSISPFPGVTVWGLRTTRRNSNTPVLSNLFVEGAGMHVGLMHGTFAGTPGLDSSICPVSPEALSRSGLDYLALGHYHNMVNCSVGRATCWYSGSPVHLNFETRGERHALLASLRDDGVRVKPIKVASRPHRVVTIDITGKSGAELCERLEDMANPDLCLRVELEGLVAPGAREVLAKLEAEFEDRFFHLKVTDRTDLPTGDQRRQDRRRRGRSRAGRQISTPAAAGKTDLQGGQDSILLSEMALRNAERDFVAKIETAAQRPPVAKDCPGDGTRADEFGEANREAILSSSCVQHECGCSKEVVDRATALGLSVLGEVFCHDDREVAGCRQKKRSRT